MLRIPSFFWWIRFFKCSLFSVFQKSWMNLTKHVFLCIVESDSGSVSPYSRTDNTDRCTCTRTFYSTSCNIQFSTLSTYYLIKYTCNFLDGKVWKFCSINVANTFIHTWWSLYYIKFMLQLNFMLSNVTQRATSEEHFGWEWVVYTVKKGLVDFAVHGMWLKTLLQSSMGRKV